MPVYNTAKYLPETIESILNQSFDDFEFIISDDGSNDGSKEIIKNYAQKDKRIVFINNNNNRGIVDNLNDCLKIINGEYIAIMESDDIADVRRFELEYDYLENNIDTYLIGSFGNFINSHGELIGTVDKPIYYNLIKKDIIKYSTFINPSVMFRKELLQKIGVFNKKYDFLQDYDFYSRCVLGGFKSENIRERLISYRIHNSASTKRSRELALKTFLLKKEIINSYKLKPHFFEKCIINIDFLTGYYLPRGVKYRLERIYKKLFYKS